MRCAMVGRQGGAEGASASDASTSSKEDPSVSVLQQAVGVHAFWKGESASEEGGHARGIPGAGGTSTGAASGGGGCVLATLAAMAGAGEKIPELAAWLGALQEVGGGGKEVAPREREAGLACGGECDRFQPAMMTFSEEEWRAAGATLGADDDVALGVRTFVRARVLAREGAGGEAGVVACAVTGIIEVCKSKVVGAIVCVFCVTACMWMAVERWWWGVCMLTRMA